VCRLTNSRSTEDSYLHYILDFTRYHNKRHPRELATDIESYGSAWGRPDLNFTLKPCTHCHCEGEVLDFPLAVLEPVLTLPNLP
jgi:hypothetical protein